MLNEPLHLFLAITIVVIGATLQSISGLGLAVIASPILFLIEPDFLPVPILILGCMLSLLNCLRYYAQLRFTNIRLALIGRIPGSVLGVNLLLLLPASFFAYCFIIFILLSVALTYRHIDITHNPRNLLLGGFFSGLMATTTSIGGPPISLVYQNSKLTTIRAELSLFFLVGTIISLLLLYISGQFHWYHIKLALPLTPAILLGFLLSLAFNKHFKQVYLKPVIAVLSLLSCCILLTRVI
jgi:uncharacterized membrane protein YfcA